MNNIYKLLVLLSILSIFLLINYLLYKTVEQFVDASDISTISESDVKTALQSITTKLCPVLLVIQQTIADNTAVERTQDAGGTRPVTSKDDTDSAFQFMLQESKSLLFSCPPPTVYQLPSDVAVQLDSSMKYSFTKLSTINSNIQQALSGNATSADDTNIKNYYNNMSSADQETYKANLSTFTAEQKHSDIQMSPTDKESLLNTRYRDLQTLLAKTNSDGSNYVETLLASIEVQYKTLQETKKQANDGTIYANSSAASDAASSSANTGNANF